MSDQDRVSKLSHAVGSYAHLVVRLSSAALSSHDDAFSYTADIIANKKPATKLVDCAVIISDIAADILQAKNREESFAANTRISNLYAIYFGLKDDSVLSTRIGKLFQYVTALSNFAVEESPTPEFTERIDAIYEEVKTVTKECVIDERYYDYVRHRVLDHLKTLGLDNLGEQFHNSFDISLINALEEFTNSFYEDHDFGTNLAGELCVSEIFDYLEHLHNSYVLTQDIINGKDGAQDRLDKYIIEIEKLDCTKHLQLLELVKTMREYAVDKDILFISDAEEKYIDKWIISDGSIKFYIGKIGAALDSIPENQRNDLVSLLGQDNKRLLDKLDNPIEFISLLGELITETEDFLYLNARQEKFAQSEVFVSAISFVKGYLSDISKIYAIRNKDKLQEGGIDAFMAGQPGYTDPLIFQNFGNDWVFDSLPERNKPNDINNKIETYKQAIIESLNEILQIDPANSVLAEILKVAEDLNYSKERQNGDRLFLESVYKLDRLFTQYSELKELTESSSDLKEKLPIVINIKTSILFLQEIANNIMRSNIGLPTSDELSRLGVVDKSLFTDTTKLLGMLLDPNISQEELEKAFGEIIENMGLVNLSSYIPEMDMSPPSVTERPRYSEFIKSNHKFAEKLEIFSKLVEKFKSSDSKDGLYPEIQQAFNEAVHAVKEADRKKVGKELLEDFDYANGTDLTARKYCYQDLTNIAKYVKKEFPDNCEREEVLTYIKAALKKLATPYNPKDFAKDNSLKESVKIEYHGILNLVDDICKKLKSTKYEVKEAIKDFNKKVKVGEIGKVVDVITTKILYKNNEVDSKFDVVEKQLYMVLEEDYVCPKGTESISKQIVELLEEKRSEFIRNAKNNKVYEVGMEIFDKLRNYVVSHENRDMEVWQKVMDERSYKNLCSSKEFSKPIKTALKAFGDCVTSKDLKSAEQALLDAQTPTRKQ